MGKRKVAGFLILFSLLLLGYIQETWVINVVEEGMPLFSRRSEVYLQAAQLSADPRWLSTLLYACLFGLGGSLSLLLLLGRTWALYVLLTYLVLGAAAFLLTLLSNALSLAPLFEVARAIKSFYLSVAPPLLWLLLYWFYHQAEDA